MKKQNVISDKSFAFAVRVVNLSKHLFSKKEYVLSKQVLRSGTAIGALVREALQAESRDDFIHKLSVSLKEANETQYWLELLRSTEYIKESDFKSLNSNLTELLKLLTSIIKSAKE